MLSLTDKGQVTDWQRWATEWQKWRRRACFSGVPLAGSRCPSMSVAELRRASTASQEPRSEDSNRILKQKLPRKPSSTGAPTLNARCDTHFRASIEFGAQTTGFMDPLRDWSDRLGSGKPQTQNTPRGLAREWKTGVFHLQEQAARKNGRRMLGRQGGGQLAGRAVELGRAREKLVVSDGAPWI